MHGFVLNRALRVHGFDSNRALAAQGGLFLRVGSDGCDIGFCDAWDGSERIVGGGEHLLDAAECA